MSLLRSVVQVLVMVLFIIVNMDCARNCENLLNFVKVMPKILLVPFFSGHGVYVLDNTGANQKLGLQTTNQGHWK